MTTTRIERTRKERTNKYTQTRINAHTYIYRERRDKPMYMRGKEESICIYDIHIDCILENTNECVLEDY
jgi:hypothetical protein